MRPKDSVQNDILWNLRWHTVMHTMTFFLLVILIAILLTVGVSVSGSETMTNMQASVKNVQAITSNLIPVSKATATAAMQNQTMTKNTTLSSAATDALVGIAYADWKSVVGNSTRVMQAIANINYTAVTSLFTQATDSDTQAAIKQQVTHALASFDFASLGLTKIMSTFENGIAARFNNRTE
jgi:hypothetical protein